MMENEKSEMMEKGDKVISGLPYLYRKNGLPGEVYEVRMKMKIDGDLLNKAIVDALKRYPYFSVKMVEKEGDFYMVENEHPLTAHLMEESIPLGGSSNDYHLIGITYFGKIMKLAFHHGLTDGRGAKNFLETVILYYYEYMKSEEEEYELLEKKHVSLMKEYSEEELSDPISSKYKTKHEKIEGLQGHGFSLPEAKEKSGHLRYEFKFSQNEFIRKAKVIGASPIIYLSMLMSRAVLEVNPDAKKPIISNFPVDAREILGCDKTFKNCVKSMTLPYGEEEKNLTDAETAIKYKKLLQAQKSKNHCAKEFNMMKMMMDAISHFHSFASRKKLLGFMENLSLNTYVISYIGQFDLPSDLVEEIHLYSSCSSGLTLNMTCQSGYFIIDMVQDFESDKYRNALKKQFENAGIKVITSDEILFETPCDELREIITSPVNTKELVRDIWKKLSEKAEESSRIAKEREEASMLYHQQSELNQKLKNYSYVTVMKNQALK